jgi:hypothetical protein
LDTAVADSLVGSALDLGGVPAMAVSRLNAETTCEFSESVSRAGDLAPVTIDFGTDEADLTTPVVPPERVDRTFELGCASGDFAAELDSPLVASWSEPESAAAMAGTNAVATPNATVAPPNHSAQR